MHRVSPLLVGLLSALLHSCVAQFPNFPGSSDETVPKKHNNGMLAAFIVLYVLFAATNVFLLIKRKSSFAPILAIHANRSDKTTDFTAFGAKADIISSTLQGLNEELLWADVSLRVPATSTLFLILGPAIFGILVVTVVTRVAPAGSAAFAAPVLLVLLVPQIYHMVVSYKQIIGGEHYTHINALTTRGAHIIQEGGCCGTASRFFLYQQMINVHTITSGNVGNVYFAEKWELENVKTSHAHHGRIHESNHKEWKKHGIGFVNVVQPMEVQSIIVTRVSGGLPPSHFQIYPGQYPQSGHTPQPGYPPQSGYPPQPVYPSQPVYPPQPGYPPQQGFALGQLTQALNLAPSSGLTVSF